MKRKKTEQKTEKKQNKKLGQVFLQDPMILEQLFDFIDLDKRTNVVEIGCGEGVLSQELVTRCKSLTIYELDPYYLRYTKSVLSDYPETRFIQGDVIKNGFSEVADKPFSIIANIPYQISSPLIDLMTQYRGSLQRAILMLQDDFAQKLVAEPGTKKYSSISIFTQFHFEVCYLFFVPKECFSPVPRVNSAFVELRPRSKPLFDVNERLFFKLIKTAFWGRRKTLLNCLEKGPYLKVPKDVREIPLFKKTPQIRGEVLSPQDFYELYTALLPIVEENAL